MPLDSYVTLGRSGLRVSPLCLGTMAFGEDWGWGSSPTVSEAILTEYLERGGNFHRHRQPLHQRPFRDDPRRLLRTAKRAPRPRRDRDEILRQLHLGDPNGGGALVDGQAAAPFPLLATGAHHY